MIILYQMVSKSNAEKTTPVAVLKASMLTYRIGDLSEEFRKHHLRHNDLLYLLINIHLHIVCRYIHAVNMGFQWGQRTVIHHHKLPENLQKEKK